MKWKANCLFSILLLVFNLCAVGQTYAATAVLMQINGAIGPATADYLERGITKAEKMGASVVVIQMDTPGGLDKSTRTIIKKIRASKVPIVTYVAPSGARAASAGTFLLYASHIAAMAPGTNLGAATPVSVGGGFPSPQPQENKDKKKEGKTTASAMEKKVINDAISYIRSLAQLTGRDIEFAEQAVREGATLTAEEAKQKGVIEIIATDTNRLFTQLDGRKVKILNQEIQLKTKNIQQEHIKPDWRTQFLAVITDPSVAYILLLIGVYGLFFEFANPGFVLPGVVGAIALLLALYAFQLLPISYAGLGLIILGVIFMVGEVFMPSFGALGIGGIIAFVAGSILLFDVNLPGYQIALPLVMAMALVNALFFFVVVSMAVRARARSVVSGQEGLLNRQGYALEDIELTGQAKIHGEIWQVTAKERIKKGEGLRVVRVDGLTLHVKKE